MHDIRSYALAQRYEQLAISFRATADRLTSTVLRWRAKGANSLADPKLNLFDTSRMNVGAMKTTHADFLLALPGLRDIVGGLNPHEGIHLHSESLLDA